MTKTKIKSRKKKKTKTNIEETCEQIADSKPDNEEPKEPEPANQPGQLFESVITEDDRKMAMAIVEAGKTFEKEFLEKKRKFMETIRSQSNQAKRDNFRNSGMDDKSGPLVSKEIGVANPKK